MKKNQDRYITVDGVRFDITTGRALPAHKQSQAPAGRSAVLDLRVPQKNGIDVIGISSKQQTLRPPKDHTVSTKAASHTRGHPQAKTKQKGQLQIEPANETKNTDYFSFVLLRFFWPKANFGLWQLSLLRTLLSPQTWLILTLPLILLQIRVLKHLTLNETLQQTKAFVAPDHYQTIIWAIGLMLTAFLIGIIIRSTITMSGMYVRLRELDNREVKLRYALRSAMHSLLRQSFNYFLHVLIMLVVSCAFILGIIGLWHSSNIWVSTNKYQLIIALSLIWITSVVLLYSKHWLQVGLLARSSKIKHLQWQSIKLLYVGLLNNLVTGFLGLTLLLTIYFAIIYMAWQLTSYFIGLRTAPAIGLLVAEAIISIVLLTALQYFQQNIWSRQYYYIATRSSDRRKLLYMEHTGKESLWPLWIAISLACILLGLYASIVVFSASRMRGFLANIHATIPDNVQLSVPIKKN